MSFASDLSAVTKTTQDGVQAIEGRTRIQGMYYLAGNVEGTIKCYDGTDGNSDLVLEIATPATSDANDIFLPDAGILFKEGVYLDFDEAASVTIFFYGGAAA
jgi:hypothetical protein